MVTVYSDQGSGNCYKVRLVLTQVGVPFVVVPMDVVRGDPRRPDYLLKNPNGKVPMVELDDGECLAESGAILYRFAHGTPLWPESVREQSHVLQWMFFEQYSHEPNVAVARFWCHYLNAEEQYREQLVAKHEGGYRALGVMEERLTEHPFLAADRYTIADIALFAYTHVAHQGGFDLERFPAIRAWIDRVASQERHISIEHVCPTA